MAGTLAELVAAELAQMVDPRVAGAATEIAARFGDAADAVLFYGSCLTDPGDGVLDFYVIVSDYRAAYRQHWLAALNRWLPPNVFPWSGDGVRAKYAVLDRADFARLCSGATENPAVWARFAQPSRLAWAGDDAARERCVAAITQAAPALLAATVPLLAGRVQVAALWERAFAETYATELRAEPRGRSSTVVARDPARYLAFAAPALAAAGLAVGVEGDAVVLPPADAAHAQGAWARRRWRGKVLSALRLLKAALTFDGGLDYLAWKIERHTAVAVRVRPWHRRLPLIGGLVLLPRLLAKGAVH